MRKGKYFILAIIAILSVVVFLCAKSMLDSNDEQNEVSANIKDKYQSYLVDCGEQIVFEDITVTLEKNYYNKDTGDACVLLSAKKNNGEAMKDEVWCDEQSGTISIRDVKADYTENITGIINGSGNIDFQYENIEGVANIYICCNVMPEEELRISFEEEHKKISDVDGAEWKSFVLKETSDSVAFKVEDMPTFASEAAIVFNCNLDIKELDIVDKDDKKVSIVKGGKLAEGCQKIYNDDIQKYICAELMDTKKIKSLSVNGESYYPEETTNQQLSANNGYICNENDDSKRTIETKVDEETNTVKVTITETWKSSEGEKSTDMLCLKWYDLYYTEGNVCKIIHKIGDKEYECQQVGPDNDLYGTLVSPISTPVKVESHTYDIDTKGIYIFTELNRDNDRATVDEMVVIELVLDLNNYNINNPMIISNSYHLNDLEKGTNTIESLSNISRIDKSLSYKLIKGDE